MTEYIITEEQLHQTGFDIEREIFDEILSRPLSEHDAEMAKKAMSDQDKHAYSEAYILGIRDGAKKERENTGGARMIETKNIGLDLAVIGSAISIIGVLLNNVLLDHIAAMQVWVISNLIFVVYFYGRRKDYWDGGVSDTVMCGMYVVMLVSGIWGLIRC